MRSNKERAIDPAKQLRKALRKKEVKTPAPVYTSYTVPGIRSKWTGGRNV